MTSLFWAICVIVLALAAVGGFWAVRAWGWHAVPVIIGGLALLALAFLRIMAWANTP